MSSSERTAELGEKLGLYYRFLRQEGIYYYIQKRH